MKCPTNGRLWLATSSLSCPVQLKTFKQSFWPDLDSVYKCVCVCTCTLGGGGGGSQGWHRRREKMDSCPHTAFQTNIGTRSHIHAHTQTNTILFRSFQFSKWSNGVLSSYPVLALPVMSPASSPTLDSLSGEPHVSSLDCWRKQNSRSPSHTISPGLLTSVSFRFLHNFTFPLRPISKYYTIQCLRQQESLVSF